MDRTITSTTHQRWRPYSSRYPHWRGDYSLRRTLGRGESADRTDARTTRVASSQSWAPFLGTLLLQFFTGGYYSYWITTVALLYGRCVELVNCKILCVLTPSESTKLPSVGHQWLIINSNIWPKVELVARCQCVGQVSHRWSCPTSLSLRCHRIRVALYSPTKKWASIWAHFNQVCALI